VRRLLVTFLIVATALLVAACDATEAETPEPGGTPVIEIPGTSWVLVSVGGTEPGIPEATVSFDANGQASGSAGCNRWNAAYSVDGSSLVFGPMATTKMACEDALMQFESRFLELMAGVTGYASAIDGSLVLRGDTELILQPTR
jgi:heat shock protein HslJ